jgi:hypothetical protein
MRTVYGLLADLGRKDVRLHLQDGELRFDAPKGALQAEDFEEIRLHKTTIIEFLSLARDPALAPPIERLGLQRAPLSPAQRRLWFIDRLEGAGSVYHICAAVRLKGVLDAAALQRAFDTVLARHEVLRTVFVSEAGEPVQEVQAVQPFALQSIDLRDTQPSELAQKTRKYIEQEAEQQFDLSQGPLIRGRLLRLGDCEHVLLLTLHHIVADGWSMGVLTKEVAELYGCYRRGQDSGLSDLPIQYSDYAIWQQQRLSETPAPR